VLVDVLGNGPVWRSKGQAANWLNLELGRS